MTDAPPGAATVSRTPPPLALVIFGASGDLTARKILPALAELANRGRLNERFCVIGVARTEWTDEEFRDVARKADPTGATRWAELVKCFRYVTGEYATSATFDRLKEVLAEADKERGTSGNRVYYLATVPAVFAEVAEALAKEGCNQPAEGGDFVRLVVEKP
ncbi:MAG: hypothetical protein ACRDVW_00705 [Acidimicrobiales bacterium]